MPKIFNKDKKPTILQKEKLLTVKKKHSKITNKTIILRMYKSNTLIWTGIEEKDTSFKEEPLVLNFDNKDFYFYSKGIEKKNHTRSVNWIFFKTLDDYKKEKLIEVLPKVIDQNDLSQKSVFFQLKCELLNNELSNLNEKDKVLKEAKIVSEYTSLYSLINENIQVLIKKDNPTINQELNLSVPVNTEKENPKTWKELINYIARTEMTEKLKKEQEVIFLKKNLNIVYKKFDSLKKIITPKIWNPINTLKQDKTKKLAIILKENSNSSFVWIGVKEKDEFSSEEPIVVNFNQEEFYFYSKRINKKTYKYNNKPYITYKNLDYRIQLKIIESFAKQNNQEPWHEPILKKLKRNVLISLANILKENLNKKGNLSNEEFMKLKDKFLSEYANFHSLLNENNSELSTNQGIIEPDDRFVISLKNKTGTVYKTFEKLKKNLTENNHLREELQEYLNFNSKQKNLSDSKKEQYMQKKLIIGLKYSHHSGYIWIGTNKKDESFSEESIVVNFNQEKFYFHLKGINKNTYKYNKPYITYKNLDYHQQEKLLNAFANEINQKYPYEVILLKMKITFLVTIENLITKGDLSTEEFMKLKDKFLSEYASLDLTIKDKRDIYNHSKTIGDLTWTRFEKENRDITNLKNKKGTLYETFEKLNKNLTENNYISWAKESKNNDNAGSDFNEGTINDSKNENKDADTIAVAENIQSWVNTVTTPISYEELINSTDLANLAFNDNILNISENNQENFISNVQNSETSTELKDNIQINENVYSLANKKTILDLDRNITFKANNSSKEESTFDLENFKDLNPSSWVNNVTTPISYEELINSTDLANLAFNESILNISENNQENFISDVHDSEINDQQILQAQKEIKKKENDERKRIEEENKEKENDERKRIAEENKEKEALRENDKKWDQWATYSSFSEFKKRKREYKALLEKWDTQEQRGRTTKKYKREKFLKEQEKNWENDFELY